MAARKNSIYLIPAAALLIAAPGLGPYQALATVVAGNHSPSSVPSMAEAPLNRPANITPISTLNQSRIADYTLGTQSPVSNLFASSAEHIPVSKPPYLPAQKSDFKKDADAPRSNPGSLKFLKIVAQKIEVPLGGAAAPSAGALKSDLDIAFDRAHPSLVEASADLAEGRGLGLPRPALASLSKPALRKHIHPIDRIAARMAWPSAFSDMRGRSKVLVFAAAAVAFLISLALHPQNAAFWLNSISFLPLVVGAVIASNYNEKDLAADKKSVEELSNEEPEIAQAAFMRLKGRENLPVEILILLVRQFQKENVPLATLSADIIGDQTELPPPVIQALEAILQKASPFAQNYAKNLLLANNPKHTRAREFLERREGTPSRSTTIYESMSDMLEAISIHDRWLSLAPYTVDDALQLARRIFRESAIRSEKDSERFEEFLTRAQKYTRFLPRLIKEIAEALRDQSWDTAILLPDAQRNMDLAFQKRVINDVPRKIALALESARPPKTASAPDNVVGIMVVGDFASHPQAGAKRKSPSGEIKDTGSRLDYFVVTRGPVDAAASYFPAELEYHLFDQDKFFPRLISLAQSHGAIRMGSLNFYNELAKGSLFVGLRRIVHAEPGQS